MNEGTLSAIAMCSKPARLSPALELLIASTDRRADSSVEKSGFRAAGELPISLRNGHNQ